MRRLAYVALTVIALNACIAYRFTTTDPDGNTKTREGLWLGPIPVIRRIRTELSRVRDDVPTRRAQLQPIPCGSEECYAAAEVNDAIETIREEVRNVFPDEAIASAISLDEELAQARAELAVAEAPALIQLVRGPPEGASGAYRRRVVDRVFERVLERINNYLSHDELNPTIHIRSNPTGARFEIQIGSNERTKYETITDNEVQSVWRGRYSGRLVKVGYRDAQPFILDLMNDSRTNVRCTIVQNSAPASAESNCRLEN
jgi:hypothetical protein